jgi:hypothetical protein
MSKRGLVVFLVVGAAALVSALAYLRDPPWLAGLESGFRQWETAADGTRYRWTGGHASFFVPAAARAIVIPMRTTFNDPTDPPVLVSIAIDDRPADEFVLRDAQWKSHVLLLPPMGRRSLRRIDVRVDRLRSGLRGVQIGSVSVAK